MASDWFSGGSSDGESTNDWFGGGGGDGGYTDKLRKRLQQEAEARDQAQFNADEIKKQQEEDANKNKSVGQRVSDVVHGAGNFAHDVVFSVKNDAVNAWQGLGDTARGWRAEQDLKANTDVQAQRNKEWSQKFNNPNWTQEEYDAKWKDPKFVQAAKDFTAETKRMTQVNANTAQDLADAQKVDAKKTAFAAASTFINATGLYGIAEGTVKAVGGAVVKNMAKDAVEQAVKTGGTDALEQIIKSGSREAAEKATTDLVKQVGEEQAHGLLRRALEKAAPEALFGSGVGVIQTGENNPDATFGDYVKGAVIGGAVGGASAGVGEVLGTARKAIAERAASKTAAKAANEEVAQLLKMKPEDYAKQFGLSVDEAKNEMAALASDGTAIADKGIKAKINNIFAPVRNLGTLTKQSFEQNAGSRQLAEMRSRAVTSQLKDAAEASGTKLDMNLAHQIENGTAPDNAFTQQFRAIADKTRQDAVDAGLDIGYRDSYVPHMWKQSEAEVDKIARGAGMKPSAGYDRIIPTYEEGIKLGLKPRYTDPAKMMGEYVKNLENTRANVALLTDLRDQGLLKSGRPPAGWKTISADGFPRTAQGNQLAAPKEVARVLNNIYGQSDSLIDKGLRKTAKFNSMWQDVALAGGIPHTPANFFTFAQAMKESALGLGQTVTGHPIQGAKTIYSPLAAFVRSFSDKETQRFAQANSGLMEALAKRGAPIQFAESTAGRTATQATKDIFSWDKLFNEPTFGRFMPNLQLNTARNVQNALEKKMGREAALDATAEVMKKLYGITDQLATGRSQAVQDAIGSIAFAPKYRESIINVLANTVKSLNPATYGDRAYSLNRRLAVGIGATYMLYDQLNKQTTGHGMAENPEGKDLQLAIPYGGKDSKGNQKVVYIPFMPSFMTLPRAGIAAVQDIAKGDQRGVVNEGGKLMSMPLQTISQLYSNKDYFGRPIYNDAESAAASRTEADSGPTAVKKQIGYVAGQASPAIPRAIMGWFQGKPAEQNVATATELPLRFGTTSPLSNKGASYSPGQVTSDWYDAYNAANAKKRAVSQEVTSLVKQGRTEEARRKANEFNDTLNSRFSKYYKKYGANPSDDKMWDEMLNGLSIKTSQRSFASRVSD